MHRSLSVSSESNYASESVVFVSQSPAPIIFLTAADTEVQTLAGALSKLPSDFPPVRAMNLLQLQQQIVIDTYAEEVLQEAEVIVLRLLGGRSYWSYGLEVVKLVVENRGSHLIVLPGDEGPNPDLMSHSTLPLSKVDQVWRYFIEGGVENIGNALIFVANSCLNTDFPCLPPLPVPRVGFYDWQSQFLPQFEVDNLPLSRVGLLFYRAHFLSGNLAPINALCLALRERNLEAVPVFVSSLREAEVQSQIRAYFTDRNGGKIDCLINTTSFAFSQGKDQDLSVTIDDLDVPVLQVILSSGTGFEEWETGSKGLAPRDMAMNVVLPEVDGRIISRAVSFKAVASRHPLLETEVVVYQPVTDRVNFVADLTANWVRLKTVPVEEKKVALILANYPAKDGRMANGVGLDTPASCVEIIKALEKAGYQIDSIPSSGDELISWLISGITNAPEGRELRVVRQELKWDEYQGYFDLLPEPVKIKIKARWGEIPEKDIAIAGINLGNVFVGIQPARGYDLDPSLNYHAPDLEPTHDYLCFYFWLRFIFQTDAIVHVGKHGNLEWLPGKSVALSEECFPEVVLGALPHFYPFIVNDPGEGCQAKRRAQAVIIDHLTPPMTRAELYGSLVDLERLIDEFYDAESLDPNRLPVIQAKINQLIVKENLDKDLGLEKEFFKNPVVELSAKIDNYLCELKEAQIRDGLHIFGHCPQNRQLRDLIISIARYPGIGRLGLTPAIARDLGLDFSPFDNDFELNDSTLKSINPSIRNRGDLIEYLESIAAELIEQIIANQDINKPLKNQENTETEINWIKNYLLPALEKTPQEITNLLTGLGGGFVPTGASGAPTRGRPEVLPTGRNFYSVDIRSLPTETAWDIGRKAAENLIEQYTQENGEYPQTLGLSIWGTSTMRTGGDDIAQALALLGVRPVWDGPSRRVIDIEIIPISLLNRPRVDVTLRISGFFRDAFSNLIDLFHQAVVAIASLKEPVSDNPLAHKVAQETNLWQAQGYSQQQAHQRALYRIFGSKPGAYGAGLQGLIESQNWTDENDLAQAYINWSSYAYASENSPNQEIGTAQPEAFSKRLEAMQIVLHNQDNREHDLLDSDDYYQFQGGLTCAVRMISQTNPQIYFGDNSIAQNPKIRPLKEEINRVYRSRIINPKWIAGVMRHGYKGASEMAATIDFLFAYDATTHCVEDFIYQGVANAYLFDNSVRQFIEEKNPWALRDMAERLLEAHQRNLWQSAPQSMLEDLRTLVHEAELTIEMK